MKASRTITPIKAAELIASLAGEYTWWVRCAEYRILRMEFGTPHLRVQGPGFPAALANDKVKTALNRRIVVPTGKWSLFIEDGLWRVEAGGPACDRLNSNAPEIDLCLDSLSGQKVTSVSISEETGSLAISFDLGGFLEIHANADFDDGNQWILFRDDGLNIASLSNGGIEVEEDA
jgi:hypothetical protein